MAAKQYDAEVMRRANYRTIPALTASISVTAVSSATPASLAAYSGQYVWLRAVTADVTIALGSRTVVAGLGLVIGTTDYTEVYIDPGDANTVLGLSHISTTNATLVVLYD